MEQKVYRVLISDTRHFYFDLEADDAQDAYEHVQKALREGDDIAPSEDETFYKGFVVEDAVEIRREDAEIDV